ncbi:MAG: nucleotidyltransferase family protein [Chloroflexi bacterium]|nr:nucleotidyltransferase family protein [Chloroflexota bacterium]
MIGVIILAAGASSRYGANKLLLPFGGGTVISTVVSTVARSTARPIVVVTGHEPEQVQAALAPLELPVDFAHNPDYRSGEMLSSIKIGLRTMMAATPAPQAIMIALGDQPLLRADVIDRLLAAFEQNCGDLIAPRFGLHGQRGHPVLIGRKWWDAVLALPPDSNVRELLRANRDSLTQLVVSNDSILGDVDTPEAYRAALDKAVAGL